MTNRRTAQDILEVNCVVGDADEPTATFNTVGLIADIAAALAQAHERGKAEGIEAERNRISDVIAADAAKWLSSSASTSGSDFGYGMMHAATAIRALDKRRD